MNNTITAKVSVRGLWKIFGPQPQMVLRSDLRKKDRAEVQQSTGHVIALREVSFDVGEGESFVVMGLSGSGKSTLVRCLLRLIEPSEGQIFVDGEEVTKFGQNKLRDFRRKKAGMVFQRFALMPHRTVIDNVAWGLEIQGQNRRDRLKRSLELLRTVGLQGWEHNFPQELSGGMQQRVGLARALAADPEVLLMDEPFSALDPLIRRDMQDELIRLQGQMKKTIIFITHDLDEALKLGSRIAIMKDGEIIQIGTPEEIVSNPSNEYVSDFTRNVRKAAILTIRSIMKPPRARVYGWQGPKVAAREMRLAEVDCAFVVDESERLQGILLHSAATAAVESMPASTASSLLVASPFAVSADDSLEAVLGRVMDYDWHIELIPVVDPEGKLVGEIHRSMLRDLAAEFLVQKTGSSPRRGAA